MKVVLTIEYDGKAFSGWQSQAGSIHTVQDELERALLVYLKAACKSKNLNPLQSIRITASGRTDSGVHAKAQVVSFLWPKNLELNEQELSRSLNGITQTELSVTSIYSCEDDFDARRNPHRKRYSYSIVHGRARSALMKDRCYWLPKRLNVAKMLEATPLLVGTHDFSAFRASDCSAETTSRTVVKSELEARGNGELVYLIEGKGFLKNMVRIIVGTLVEVGQEKREPSSLTALLKSGQREQAGKTAPAQGLYLEYVYYKL